jgi:hypothetical protein
LLVKKEDNAIFTASRGEDNDVLPGEIFDVFRCTVGLDSMTFVSPKGESYILAFPLLSEASFGDYVYQGNLWFRCVAEGKRFCFCAAPKEWKSPAGKKLRERIGHYVKIGNTKALDTYLSDGPVDVIMTLLLH